MISIATKKPELSLDISSAAPPAPSNEKIATHIFKSKLPDIPISNHLPLHTYCFQDRLSDDPCLIVGLTGKTYSYAETHLICRKTAAGLSNLGIKKGDVIMILLQNCAEFVFSFIGASMIGAVTTTANPFYTSAEILKQFRTSGAKLIITMSQYVDRLPKTDKNFTVITIDAPPENCLHFTVLSEADEDQIPEGLPSSPTIPGGVPFSSAPTGLPKGVVLTHKSIDHPLQCAAKWDGEKPESLLDKRDVVARAVLALCYHIYSLNSGLSVLLGPGVRCWHRSQGRLLRADTAATGFGWRLWCPPLVLALAKNPMVADYDLSSVRVVLSGAAPLGKELEDALRSRVPQAILGQGYGMTEAGPVLSMCLGFAKQPFPTKSGSCGTVVRNAELKVIDPEIGASLPHNQPGEICIRGPQIMKGYLNDPEATAATIDVEGWLHTGDIGYVDDDDEVFIVDRVKEIIKFKGFQAYSLNLLLNL
ncbi:hypothetical protein CUMW_114710 [Citrus unshiu]|nr:hypothetical protein CUMW_114710 [Citrus unshiu]